VNDALASPEPEFDLRVVEYGPLKVSIGPQHETCYVELEGELDLSNAHAVDKVLKGLDGGSAERVILDLSGLRFVDSTGLVMLLRATNRARANGDRLRMLRPSQTVQRLFVLCQVDGALPFVDTDTSLSAPQATQTPGP